MKKIALFVVMALVSSLSMMAAVSTDAVRVAGGDLSLVPAYEKVGDKWLDADGNTIDDMVSFVKNTCGWTAVRVRLFVEPGNDNDPATCPGHRLCFGIGQTCQGRRHVFSARHSLQRHLG